MHGLKLPAVAGLALALSVTLGAQAGAQADVESFYRDRQVTIVVAAGAGGPFGLRAQILQEHLGRHIPGNPTVVVQYMPGAGGRKAANYLYNAAPKDGGVIGILFYNTALSYRLLPEGASFDPLEFNWLGSQTPIFAIGFVWHTAPATSIEAMKSTEVIFGASGTTSPTGMYPAVLNTVAGTKIRIVKGYRGVADYMKAVETGEIHGAMSGWDALASRYGDRVRQKHVIPIVQFTLEKHPELSEVPLMTELARNADGERIASFMSASTEIGHTNVAPPGVPQERLEALRKGIAATYRDPDAIAAADKMQVPVAPVSAERVRKLVEDVMAAPDDIVAKAKAAAGL